jgi:FkbM family methyltransferase
VTDLAAQRIAQTVACRDADAIPKVANAGEVIERDGIRVQVMHNGLVIEEGCYHGAWMTEVIRRLRGHHEPQEERAFHTLVERLREDTPAPVMVELGSFWAYYALWLKTELPAARVLLVEPDPANLDAGRRNFALNGLEGQFVAAAVGLPDGALRPFVSESDGKQRDTLHVSLDGLMARERLKRVDIVLCDIQGGELDALRGATRAMAERSVRFLVISTHHHRISGDPLMHQRCLDALLGAGAHILAEHAVSESCSGDGLIVASLDPRDRELVIEITHARAQDTLFGGLERDLAEALAERDELRRRLAVTEAQRDRLAARPWRRAERALRGRLG